MTSKTFVDGTTIIDAAWLNDVNTGVYTTLPLKANSASPTLTTPNIGVATATSVNRVTITQPATGSTLTIPDGTTATVSGTNTGDQLVFKTISVSGQSDVVADTLTDTLTLVAGAGMTITTNASTDTITLVSSSSISPAAASDVKTGTSNTLTVTPLSFLGGVGFSAYTQTADQSITAAGALTIAHGLGRTPVLVLGFLKNVTAEGNYSPGDIVPCPLGATQVAANYGVIYTADVTNLSVRFASNATNTLLAIDKTAGATFSITNTKWSFFMRVWA